MTDIKHLKWVLKPKFTILELVQVSRLRALNEQKHMMSREKHYNFRRAQLLYFDITSDNEALTLYIVKLV